MPEPHPAFERAARAVRAFVAVLALPDLLGLAEIVRVQVVSPPYMSGGTEGPIAFGSNFCIFAGTVLIPTVLLLAPYSACVRAS